MSNDIQPVPCEIKPANPLDSGVLMAPGLSAPCELETRKAIA